MLIIFSFVLQIDYFGSQIIDCAKVESSCKGIQKGKYISLRDHFKCNVFLMHFMYKVMAFDIPFVYFHSDSCLFCPTESITGVKDDSQFVCA